MLFALIMKFDLFICVHYYRRSVLIIDGNGAYIAKHCVPSVHDKRYVKFLNRA